MEIVKKVWVCLGCSKERSIPREVDLTPDEVAAWRAAPQIPVEGMNCCACGQSLVHVLTVEVDY